MFTHIGRRALTVGVTATTAGAILIPNATAADLSTKLDEIYSHVTWRLLNFLFWDLGGFLDDLGLLGSLGNLSM
ncbi:MAG: hypothetical protein Q4A92_03895 [Corynebacterium sp.]|nr:hypothetical protein [Corynebacterium sp.]